METKSYFTTVEKRSAYRFAVDKHEGKRSLGRPTHRLKGNITINSNVGHKGVEYILLAQNRDACRKFRFHMKD